MAEAKQAERMSSLPLHALSAAQLPMFLAALPDASASFLRASGFAAKPGDFALIPGADGLVGAVVGIVLGVGLGWVIVYALRDQGLSAFSVPVGTTVSILIMAFVIGVLAAVYPAWRATRVNLLSAITTA